MNNPAISELYGQGLISGETFFFCVEHQINSAQEFLMASVDGESDVIHNDFKSIKEEFSKVEIEVKTEPGRREAGKSITFTDLDSIFHKKIKVLPVRAYHGILYFYENECGKSIEEFCARVYQKNFDIMSMKNIGTRSYNDVLYFLKRFKKECRKITYKKQIISEKEIEEIETKDSEESTTSHITQNPDRKVALHLFCIEQDKILSTRTQNAIRVLCNEECNGCIDDLYKTLCNKNFNVASIKNVGRKSGKEFEKFILDFRSFYEHNYLKPADIGNEEKNIVFEKIFNISSEKIFSLQDEIGHFPLFYAIEAYIQNLSKRDNIILKYQIDIYNNQELKPRPEVGQLLDLTPERVRQLRKDVFKHLEKAIVKFSHNDLIDLSYYTKEISENINADEGTNFQDNFIFWALSLISDKYAVVGNLETVFFNPHNHQVNLSIVDKSLTNDFNFNKFEKKFEKTFYEKRSSEEVVHISMYAYDCYKTGGILHEEQIINACREIISRNFLCEFNGDKVILQGNTYKNLGDIAEEAIRALGRPSTKEDILSYIYKNYPDRNYNINSVSTCMNYNHKIRPIGRSGTYTLTEWNDETYRGGTIREFALEYIQSQKPEIASLTDVTKYVKKFRPTTNESSVVSNLAQETNNLFTIFYRVEGKENVRYIGLKNHSYAKEFIKQEDAYVGRRDFTTSCNLFKEFVQKHNRMPFYKSKDIEEERLSRWLRVATSLERKGKLEDFERKLLEELNQFIAPFNINKKDYDWRRNADLIKEHLRSKPISELNESLMEWLSKNIQLMRYDRLNDWKQKEIKKIIDLIPSC